MSHKQLCGCFEGFSGHSEGREDGALEGGIGRFISPPQIVQRVGKPEKNAPRCILTSSSAQ